MRIGALALLLLLLLGCGEPSRSVATLGPVAAERLYRSCAGSSKVLKKATNVSWRPVKSKIEEHRSLRDRLRLSFPSGSDRILFHSLGSHHTTAQFSVVAVRRGDGIWHADAAGETGPGLLQIPTTATPHKAYDLSREESRRLDGLLKDRCLNAAPTFMRDPNIVSGGALQTLEIETAGDRAVLSWFMIRTPQEEQIINLIAGD